ncbi:MAG: IS3 family transposase [Treponemataceae bacterium]|nr:IS3 family transposase [Treponemataceae bacterium]
MDSEAKGNQGTKGDDWRSVRGERHTKKSKSLVGNLGRDRILTLQGELMEDGIRARIRMICEALGFNRSNVYYAEKPHKKRSETDETWLVDEIRTVIEEFPEYGTRRITAVLRRRHSKSFNRKKIHRIVKEQCWQRWKRPYGNRPRVKGMQSVTP